MYITYRQKMILGAVALMVLLVLSSTVAYLVFFEEEKTTKKVEAPLIMEDDRISPLTNQGLIFEIKRIRHRGLLEKIMGGGFSWRSPPSFYFVTNIDDQEYVSKNVRATAGAKSETLFSMWDTMFLENKINRDAEEEQETSTLTLTLFERTKGGILGLGLLGSTDTEKESISLTYNYRTGRWEGDDFFNDTDGYGHYLGDTFEVWFNVYQTDYDGDGIPYWTENNVLGTDPMIDDSILDPDQDGIPTDWEWRWGYDPFTFDNHTYLDPDVDGLENSEEYKMRKYFANPYHQDIYLEVDYMQKKNFFDEPHELYEETRQIMTERYAQHNICIYIDNGWPNGGGGDYVRYYDTVSQDSGMMLQFYENHFADDRKGIFRYALIANKAGFCHPSKYNRYDTMAVGTEYNLMFTFLRKSFFGRGKRLGQASDLMHELGHSLGIGPWNVGGNDNGTYNNGREAKEQYLQEWGNYKSVMNYYYIWDYSVVDYSDGSHGEGDVSDWDLFDLTFFQQDAKVVEDPGFELPGEEEI